jgi:hypothetical protein
MVAASNDHSDLYSNNQLRINEGQLHLSSIHTTGYGYASPPDTAARTTEHDWSWPET